jgi:hypothetical protein
MIGQEWRTPPRQQACRVAPLRQWGTEVRHGRRQGPGGSATPARQHCLSPIAAWSREGSLRDTAGRQLPRGNGLWPHRRARRHESGLLGAAGGRRRPLLLCQRGRAALRRQGAGAGTMPDFARKARLAGHLAHTGMLGPLYWANAGPAGPTNWHSALQRPSRSKTSQSLPRARTVPTVPSIAAAQRRGFFAWRISAAGRLDSPARPDR